MGLWVDGWQDVFVLLILNRRYLCGPWSLSGEGAAWLKEILSSSTNVGGKGDELPWVSPRVQIGSFQQVTTYKSF